MAQPVRPGPAKTIGGHGTQQEAPSFPSGISTYYYAQILVFTFGPKINKKKKKQPQEVFNSTETETERHSVAHSQRNTAALLLPHS